MHQKEEDDNLKLLNSLDYIKMFKNSLASTAMSYFASGGRSPDALLRYLEADYKKKMPESFIQSDIMKSSCFTLEQMVMIIHLLSFPSSTSKKFMVY